MRIRRTKVTVVTEHVFTFAEPYSAVQLECEKCGAPLRCIQSDEVAARSSVNLEAFQRKFEAEGFHFSKAANGAVLMCLNSLRK